jgi:hypothetical protein
MKESLKSWISQRKAILKQFTAKHQELWAWYVDKANKVWVIKAPNCDNDVISRNTKVGIRLKVRIDSYRS